MDDDIAIVGMACRFPGADNVDTFWENLCAGIESVRCFSDDELIRLNIDKRFLMDPSYIKASGVIAQPEYFDAAFFGYTPREAENMDPQQRLFLETAWLAMEHAGHNPLMPGGCTGVFAGCSANRYFLYHRFKDNNQDWEAQDFPVATQADALASQVSYKLAATGPSMAIQTACSSSLVAVATASQSLLDYRCDFAIAGGVALKLPSQTGYLYQADGMYSKTGHCKSFDKSADGSVFGSGVGVVILRRLADAINDGDTIYSVIRGWAVNNDGATRAGYTAPGLNGQANVVVEAQMCAGVSPNSLGYIEAHGSATRVGDPIEFAGLKQAFRLGMDSHVGSDKNQFCALGCVKTNLGHLDAAAGIAGLIKTVLILQRHKIPPTLHFSEPNPDMEYDDSPFYINTELQTWAATDQPRIAGVSSFGLGGTNAHIVLQEPPSPPATADGRTYKIIPVSARTQTALQLTVQALEDELKNSQHNIADIAYTQSCGRAMFQHRAAIIASNKKENTKTDQPSLNHVIKNNNEPPVSHHSVFIFPGLGDQYQNMGLELYHEEPIFRETMDYCAEQWLVELGFDIRDYMYPEGIWKKTCARQALNRHYGNFNFRSLINKGDNDPLQATLVAQPVCFAFSYALAKLFMSWGIMPVAMAGHSLGEYVAAAIAGVIDLDQVLLLIATRAKLISRLEPGVMLAVPLSEESVESFLNDNISLSAVNQNELCVLAGDVASIELLEQKFNKQGIAASRLRASQAFHSHLMQPVVQDLYYESSRIRFNTPSIPYVSNVTGDWVSNSVALKPDYWSKHLCETVRFSQNLDTLAASLENPLFIELGPGQTLSSLVASKFQLQQNQTITAIPVIKPYYNQDSSMKSVMEAVAQLWVQGVEPDWEKVFHGQTRKRIACPVYPFERKRYWIDRKQNSTEINESLVSIQKTNVQTDKQSNNEITDQVQLTKPSEEEVVQVYPRPELDTPYLQAATETEKKLQFIWQKHFGYEAIGIDDNFLALGGHSLLALQIAHDLSSSYGIQTSLVNFLRYPTIALLAKTIDTDDAEPDLGINKSPQISMQTPAKETCNLDAVRIEQKIIELYQHVLQRPVERLETLNQSELEEIIPDTLKLFRDEFKTTFYPNELMQAVSASELAHYVNQEMDKIKQFSDDVLINSSDTVTEKSLGFILSSPRSGSTLLRVMLAGHPDLFCPPELHLLDYSDMRQREKNFRTPDRNQGLHRAMMELQGVTTEQAAQAIDKMSAQNESTVSVMQKLIQLSSPMLLIDKSPGYTNSVNVLSGLEKKFHRPKYIVLVRHPYAVIESLVRNRFNRLMEGGETDPFDYAEFVWSRSVGNTLDFIETIEQSRYYLLKYEDLVTRPQASMEALCKMLGISFNENLLSPYQGRRMRDGLGDPNFLSHTTIDSRLANAWRKQKLPRKLGRAARELAAALDYEIE